MGPICNPPTPPSRPVADLPDLAGFAQWLYEPARGAIWEPWGPFEYSLRPMMYRQGHGQAGNAAKPV